MDIRYVVSLISIGLYMIFLVTVTYSTESNEREEGEMVMENKDIENNSENNLEKEMDERLENIIFGKLDGNGGIYGVKEIKKVRFNKNRFIILIFETGRKIIMKNEKKIKIDGEEYSVKVRDDDVVEFKNQSGQIFFLKIEKGFSGNNE